MWLLLILLVSIWMLSGTWKRRKLRQIAREIGCDIQELPIIGHSYKYLGSDEDRMKAIQCFGAEAIIQGGSCHVWMCNTLMICTADPVVVDFISKNCPEKVTAIMDVIYDTFGYMSPFAPVTIWRPRRKTLAPLFSLKHLNGLVETFAIQTAVLVEQLKPTVGASDVSLWPFLNKCTFDIITESTFGVKLNVQTEDNKLVRYIDQTMQIVSKRFLQPWLQWHLLYRLFPDYWRCRQMVIYATNFVDDIIKDKHKSSNGLSKQDADNDHKCIINAMMDSTRFTDVEIREEAMIIMMAGMDTTATGVGFTLVLLSRYPAVQDAVYRELFEVFGNSDRPVTGEDLPKLKYLELVVKESMRMYPPIPMITREISSDVKIPSGTTLVKGVVVMLNIWSIHRNPEYWGADVDQFRPERFLEGLRHPAQFFPFGNGMRNCLGLQYAMMSMKILLSTLLRNYRVLPPSGLDPNQLQEPLRVKYDIVLRHVDKFNVRLEKRL